MPFAIFIDGDKLGSSPGGGSTTWGSITGTLSSQADLQTALNGKSNTGHTHAYNTLTGLPTLGTMAAQNANSVSIGGGTITGLSQLSVAGSSSISAGLTNSINLISGSVSGTITLRNSTNSARYALNASGFHEFISGESTTPFSFTLNNATNGFVFERNIRDRTSGSGSQFTDKIVNTTSALSLNDNCSDTWQIVPTTGVKIQNTILHKVIDNNSVSPDSCFDFSPTDKGSGKNVFRIGGGVNGFFFGNNVTLLSNRVGLFYNGSSGYNLVFPSAQGGASTVLQNDGSGNLSWATPSGGGGGSGVSATYVKDVFRNVQLGTSAWLPGYVIASIMSDGRAFVGISDSARYLLFSSSTVNGTYSQIASSTSGGVGAFIADIGPSASNIVFVRTDSATGWLRWNGTTMVAPTTAVSMSAGNPPHGIGYNGNILAISAGGTTNASVYSTDGGNNWTNASNVWHQQGALSSAGNMAVGVVGGGSTFVTLTQLNSSPNNIVVCYGAITSTPTRINLSNGYLFVVAYDSDGTRMAVLFRNGTIGVTTDGATWSYLSIGTLPTAPSGLGYFLKIRSSDIIVGMGGTGRIYSISHDLTTINWIRPCFNMIGNSNQPSLSSQYHVLSNEIYYATIGSINSNSLGYHSCSLEKLTFS